MVTLKSLFAWLESADVAFNREKKEVKQISTISVAVVSNVGRRSVSRSSLVLTLGCSSVSLSALEKCSLRSLHILLLALPGLEHGLLEGATVGESEGPGSRRVLDLVHCVQVQRGGLL